jgi:hypothetical protein
MQKDIVVTWLDIGLRGGNKKAFFLLYDFRKIFIEKLEDDNIQQLFLKIFNLFLFSKYSRLSD